MDKIKNTFNKILEIINKKDYNLIIKSKDKLVIENNELIIKLGYVQILAVDEKEIFWSDENEFIDKKTKIITKVLKEKLNKSKINHTKDINNELLYLINKYNSIEINKENINLLGLIIEPYNSNIGKLNKYFLITDILFM